MPAPQVNLLTRNNFESTSWGKISLWALNIGRIIVLIVLVTVIGALASRFYLDRQIALYKEDINDKKFVIETYARQEAEFRRTQERLRVLSDLVDTQSNLEPMLTDINTNLPIELALQSIIISQGNTVTIKGTADNEESVSTFISNLRLSESFLDINLDNLETKSDDTRAYFFALSATYQL